MSNKPPKKSLKEKRKDKHVKKLDREGRLVKGVVIPKDTLAADPDKQAHRGGYSIKFSYSDIDFVCAGCGKECHWTAQQQKRYYEDQQGNIYNEPKWCYDCHTKKMRERFGNDSDDVSL